MEAHVSTMSAEDYWQTTGKHKSNIGGGSVIGGLSVAGLVFINQDHLCLIGEVWEGLSSLQFQGILHREKGSVILIWFETKR